MSDQLININLIIADRPYPLKIRPSEEETVRKAGKEIAQKIKEFQGMYEGKDKQDYLAMCALMYAVENLNREGKVTIEDDGFVDKLTELEELLDGVA